MSDLTRTLRREVARLKEENDALREEVMSLRQYLDALYHLVDAIDQLDPSQEVVPLLDRMLQNAMQVLSAKDGSLLVRDEESNELVFVLARGEVDPRKLVGQRVPAGKGIAGWVVQHKRPTIVNQARSDDRFYAGVDQAMQFQTNSVLAVPIIGRGDVLGVIEMLNKQNGLPFNTADQTMLLLLCKFAGEVLYTMVERDKSQEPSASA
jgi:GAF domain-containing protein